MFENLRLYIDNIARLVELLGVMIMFVGLCLAVWKAIRALPNFSQADYIDIRQLVGKSILLGLEVLILADIMATVVTTPTLNSVTVLAGIVLIRTFLSWSLQVELEGRLPWQKKTD